MDYKNYLKEYLDFIKYDRDLSDHSVKVRRQWLSKCFSDLSGQALTYENIRSQLRIYKKSGLSPNYIQVLITALNSYIRFLIAEEHLPIKDITSNLNALRPRKKIVLYQTLSIEEIEKVINPPDRKPRHNCPDVPHLYPKYNEVDEMWSIFLEFMAKTGCRVGEVVGLNVGDLNFGAEEFIIRETKTDEQRIVPIPPDMISRLDQWVKTYRGGVPQTAPLFVSMHFRRTQPNRRIGASMVNKAIRERAKRAGLHVDRRYHAHSFRHSFVTELLREDVAISKVQRIVGHRKVDTTMIYTHMITDDLRDAMLKHPLIRKSQDPRDIIRQVKEEIKSFKLHEDPRFSYQLTEKSDGVSFDLTLKERCSK